VGRLDEHLDLIVVDDEGEAVLPPEKAESLARASLASCSLDPCIEPDRSSTIATLTAGRFVTWVGSGARSLTRR
jgi:hypothetical protein